MAALCGDGKWGVGQPDRLSAESYLCINFCMTHTCERWHSSLMTHLYFVQNYQQDLELAFKMFDLDGDGYVCAEDLKGVMKMLGNDLSGANEFLAPRCIASQVQREYFCEAIFKGSSGKRSR